MYIPFYSDFDLSKSTNHHLDFCDWETGETPSALREVLPKDGVAACQVWVGELGHFFWCLQSQLQVEAGMPSLMLSIAAYLWLKNQMDSFC